MQPGRSPLTPRPTWRFRLVARLVIGLLSLLRWRMDDAGIGHVPHDGGAVIACNHNGHLDLVATAWVVYRRLGRPVRFLIVRELWRSRLLGWIPRLLDAVPVDRGSSSGRLGALQDAVRALGEGHLVMVAPEATISRSFELLPFHNGAARMAQLAQVPIVPSVSWGTHRAATTDHPFRPGRAAGIPVEVRFGEAVHVAPDDHLRAVTAALRDRMERMLHEVQETYPDGAPAGSWWVPARLGGGAPSHEEVLAERERTRRDAS